MFNGKGILSILLTGSPYERFALYLFLLGIGILYSLLGITGILVIILIVEVAKSNMKVGKGFLGSG